MSQPPYEPTARAPGGGHPQPPYGLAPAAPTQRIRPAAPPEARPGGQAPPPEQPPPPPDAPLATGFPGYVSPPPSPPNRTGLIVGTVVVVVTILFAVLGFLLVA